MLPLEVVFWFAIWWAAGSAAHKVGDFLFQTSWIALTKQQPNRRGWTACTVHCCIYTAVFLLLTLEPWKLAAIFISHWAIDHWRLAAVWARFINGEWVKEQPVIPAWCITEIDQIFHRLIAAIVLML